MHEIMTGKLQIGNWTFNEINLSDMDMYSEYIKATEYPANLWSSNFAYLWASGRSSRKKILWKEIDGMLATFGYTSKKSLYLMCLPFGKGNCDHVVEVLEKCLRFCYETDNNDATESILRMVNSMQLDFLRESKAFTEHFKTIPLVGIERHFSIPKLVRLESKEFRSLRKKVNRFRNLCPEVTVRDYIPDDFDDVMKIGQYWNETSGQKYSTIFDKVYFREIIKHCKELDHKVMVVEKDKKIIGVVTGGGLPTGQAWGCLSKFVNQYDGLSEFMIVKFVQEIHKEHPEMEYLNTGSDLGPGGLRAYKDKFRPVLNLKRYRVQLKPGE